MQIAKYSFYCFLRRWLEQSSAFKLFYHEQQKSDKKLNFKKWKVCVCQMVDKNVNCFISKTMDEYYSGSVGNWRCIYWKSLVSGIIIAKNLVDARRLTLLPRGEQFGYSTKILNPWGGTELGLRLF